MRWTDLTLAPSVHDFLQIKLFICIALSACNSCWWHEKFAELPVVCSQPGTEYQFVARGSSPKVSFASVQLLEALGLGEQTSQDPDVFNKVCIKPGWRDIRSGHLPLRLWQRHFHGRICGETPCDSAVCVLTICPLVPEQHLVFLRLAKPCGQLCRCVSGDCVESPSQQKDVFCVFYTGTQRP